VRRTLGSVERINVPANTRLVPEIEKLNPRLQIRWKKFLSQAEKFQL
jgi:hypothetical protein